MRTNSLFITAALLLGGALPAVADHGRPEQVVPSHRAIQIDEYQPQSGGVGSLVTIRGRGLSQVAYVLVGGYQATPEQIGAYELSFRIPRQHGDGSIVLYVPGRGQVAVGPFTVFSMLAIEGLSPRSGTAGTEVQIFGSGFQHGDRVYMNHRQLAVLHLDHDRIVVRIPANAYTDHLTVVRHGGVSERTAERFRVLQAQPRIHAVSPPGGLPGTQVRITGEGFGHGCNVFYGQEALPVLGHGHHSIDVRIPDGAKRDEFLYVHCAGEQDRSPHRFRLAHARRGAEIHAVSPGRVLAGDTVTIRGIGFDPYTRVFWGRHELRVLRRSRNGKRLEVLAPAHVHGTDALYLDDGSGRTHSGEALEILPRSYSHQRSAQGRGAPRGES